MKRINYIYIYKIKTENNEKELYKINLVVF